MPNSSSSKKVVSAGLLMFRRRGRSVEFLLVHPGGPFFAKKDAGVWTIPKGLVEEGEDPLTTAKREFEEETSFSPASEHYLSLGEIRQKGGKWVHAWAFEGDGDPEELRSNLFEMEWPPRSGRRQSFPEVDRGAWFEPEAAAQKINTAQVPFLERLLTAHLEETQDEGAAEGDGNQT